MIGHYSVKLTHFFQSTMKRALKYIEYDEDIDEWVITSGVVKLSWEEKAARAREYHLQQKEVMAKTTTIPNEKLESCIPKLIDAMKKCQNAAGLCGLVEMC